MKTTTCLRSLAVHLFFPFVLACASGCAAAADGAEPESSSADVETVADPTSPPREALAHTQGGEDRQDKAVSHVTGGDPGTPGPIPDGPTPVAKPHREQ